MLAGSASKKTDSALIDYGHEFVKLLIYRILSNGGGLVLGVGKEPFHDGSNPPSLIFDWTALETVIECVAKDCIDWPSISGSPIVVVTSEKARSEIPPSRLKLWEQLISTGRVNVEFIQPGARSGALLRDRQSQLADILVILGGGTGVEHLSRLFIERQYPVIPLDLELGASREDGLGGAPKLAAEAREELGHFFSLQSKFSATAGAAYSSISMQGGSAKLTTVADSTLTLLKNLSLPMAFYTRLLNPTIASFERVEDFFRNVVDTVVEVAGFCPREIGTNPAVDPFINVEIFKSLHYSSVAVVDLTGERPNCYMELGYAFGRGIKVIMTAEEGTALPFDPGAIPCFFWRHGEDNIERREKLRVFWRTYVDRLPLVS